MWSIRARLTLWYSSVVVVVLVVAAVAVALVQERLAQQRLDDDLERTMLTLEGVMRTEFGEGLTLRAAATEASSEVVAPDRALVLAQPDGQLLAAWGVPLDAAWRPPVNGRQTVTTLSVGSASFRMRSRPVEYRDHRYIAAVLAPLAASDAQHAEMLLALAIGVVIALVAAAVGGWVIGQQALRPLSDMAQQASRINEHTSSTRLRARYPNDELGQLGTAFNALLDRLASALNAQRQFMADASHELRTPVSVVQTTAQVTLARKERTDVEYRESLAIVSEQAARLAHLVDAMFLLSRAEAQGIPLRHEPVNVDDLVADSARALRVLATERGVCITTDGDTEVSFSGDDTLLRQMVGNLLDNAIRFARPSGAVTAVVRRTPDGIVIRICDDGPGVPPADRARIFERFVRVGPRSGGAGLGLPIARWIAEAHGGHLILESADPSQTCFTVTLPCP
jgi:two-component system, OmpR family, sensor kinase